MRSNRLLSAAGCGAVVVATLIGVASIYGEDAAPTTQPGPIKINVGSANADGTAPVTVITPSTNQPTTQPAVAAAPTTKPSANVSAEAKTELDALSAAYSKLTSLNLTGTLSVNLDADGQKKQDSAPFTGSFQSPNKFRNQTKDDALLGSAGDKMYVYFADEKAYLQQDAPKTKADFSNNPNNITKLLFMQNPSLFLAMADKPSDTLIQTATDVTKIDDTKVGDQAYSTLLVKTPQADVKVLIDPNTHLLRQMQMDLSKQLKASGAMQVNAATQTFDYTSTVPNAPMKVDQFAWAPPEGAKDIAKDKEMMGDDDAAANALVGKPAPALELPGLDGSTASLAKLKGTVVILDFWATWCPPCRASLPHLDKLYQAKKADGLKVFACDMQEEKDDVQKFVNDTKLGLPVLMIDKDSKLPEAYGVSGIPETVLIGKDGLVKKVIIGFSEEEIDGLTKAVDAELAAK